MASLATCYLFSEPHRQTHSVPGTTTGQHDAKMFELGEIMNVIKLLQILPKTKLGQQLTTPDRSRIGDLSNVMRFAETLDQLETTYTSLVSADKTPQGNLPKALNDHQFLFQLRYVAEEPISSW